MVGQGRKWVQSTRLLSPRRFLSLRDPQPEASDLSGVQKAAIWQPHTATGNRGYPVEWARQTRPKRPGMVPSIGGSGLALTWALFHRGDAHARCVTRVWSWLKRTGTAAGSTMNPSQRTRTEMGTDMYQVENYVRTTPGINAI